MSAAFDKKKADFIATAPETTRRILTDAFAGEASPRGAIKAYCLTCACFDRKEITHCTVVLCPLHAYRPFQDRDRQPKIEARSEIDSAAQEAPSEAFPATISPGVLPTYVDDPGEAFSSDFEQEEEATQT